jgi:hypothetical protein
VSTHLYNSTIGKAFWFVKRFGLSELFLKPLRLTFAPWILPRLAPAAFQFRGREFGCHYARYNMTWAGERMVEIPIARQFLADAGSGPILEVGNVLSHYGPVPHEILDKFEKGEGVINADIIDFHPSQKYRLILSISTFEHIGFDDESQHGSGAKILAATQHCQSLLAPDGRLVLTVPVGYNPDLDRLIQSNTWQARQVTFLWRREGRHWVECDWDTAIAHPYKSHFPYANAIAIAEFAPRP